MRNLSSKAVTLAALGTASVALIGVGASATFTDAESISSSFAAGTFGIDLTNPSAGAATTADGGLALAPVTNLGSDYVQTYTFRIENVESLDVQNVRFVFSNAAPVGAANPANASLARESLITVDCAGYRVSDEVADLGSRPETNYFAGSLDAGESVGCTLTLRAVDGGLTNSSQGGTVAPQLTISATDA